MRDKYAKYAAGKVTYNSNGDGARRNHGEVDNGIRKDNSGCFPTLLLPFISLLSLGILAVKFL